MTLRILYPSRQKIQIYTSPSSTTQWWKTSLLKWIFGAQNLDLDQGHGGFVTEKHDIKLVPMIFL